jgi:hypothetical protein
MWHIKTCFMISEYEGKLSLSILHSKLNKDARINART